MIKVRKEMCALIVFEKNEHIQGRTEDVATNLFCDGLLNYTFVLLPL